MNKKVSILIIVTNEAQYSKCLSYINKQSIIDLIEVIKIDNQNNSRFFSAASAFNYGVKQAKGDYFVFMHQDVYLYDAKVIEKTISFLDENPTALVGSAGCLLKDHKLHTDMIMAGNCLFDERLNGKTEECYSLDECYFAIKKDRFMELGFDEKVCNSWHFYAVDLSYRNHWNQGKNYALSLKIAHDSAGNIYTKSFFTSLKRIIAAYHGRAVYLYTPCVQLKCSLLSIYWNYLLIGYIKNYRWKNFKTHLGQYLATYPSFISVNQKFHSKVLLRLIKAFMLIPSYLLYKHRKNTKFIGNDIYIATIVKNEGSYLKEWLEYYRMLGISKVVIFDNESTDDTAAILANYIKEEFVDYYLIKGKKRQVDAYNLALAKYYNKAKYIAFIDADEFIVPTNGNNLAQEIQTAFTNLKNPPAIALNWRIFGSSHFQKKPEGLVIENYTHCSETDYASNYYIKSIFDPRRTIASLNPHYLAYPNNMHALSLNGQTVDEAYNFEIVMNPLHINHYFTKSKEEFLLKIKRGKADVDDIREEKEFEVEDRNEVLDESMLKYVPAIKKAIEENG